MPGMIGAAAYQICQGGGCCLGYIGRRLGKFGARNLGGMSGLEDFMGCKGTGCSVCSSGAGGRETARESVLDHDIGEATAFKVPRHAACKARGLDVTLALGTRYSPRRCVQMFQGGRRPLCNLLQHGYPPRHQRHPTTNSQTAISLTRQPSSPFLKASNTHEHQMRE